MPLCVEEIESVFNLFDTDGSGRISEGECVYGLKALGFEKVTKEDLEEIMGEKPASGEARTVAYAEFKERLLNCTKMSHVKEVEGAFKMFDVSKSNVVGLADLREVSAVVRNGAPASDRELQGIIRAVSDGMTEIYYSDFTKAVGQKDVEYPMGAAVPRKKMDAAGKPPGPSGPLRRKASSDKSAKAPSGRKGSTKPLGK
eukprot:TRINITY_DN16662_c0_g1_i1.p1 TRINITY_DN16662_c0_g1~~TRINITY_DN16662_c0_g1_i1.p1  ORF type:complete len:200 (+),score=79.19 TRINITY_DN16662_c0_g1_i1:109-708(+)